MQTLKEEIPDFQRIMLPMLQLLENGQTKTLNEVMQLLTAHFKLTSAHLKIKVPSGTMGLFRNRVGWTRSYLKNAGLISYPSRGVYKITEYGTAFLASNPKALNIQVLKTMPKYKEWAATFNQDTNGTTNTATKVTDNQTPDELLNTTVNELHQQLATDLIDKLKDNTFEFFEKFVVELLQKMGYGAFREEAGKVTGQSGDHGIDGIIYQDRLGLESVYIQAKRYNDTKVGSPDIRNFIGSLALQGVNKGVFLTTSRFSEAAVQTADNSKQQKIVLIDGKKLADLAIEFNLGVQENETIVLKKIDLDYFEE
ncbi:Restriction endonuclease [Tenacibaculum sp. 190524A02b]|uniref:restriction endonuclease n=1 Tax=Tenacibaculum vairaonense TaxID=3137860 RepID=UPI0032B20A28